jgi:hypothetical protein
LKINFPGGESTELKSQGVEVRKKVLRISGALLLLLVILVGVFHTPFVKAKVLKHLQKILHNRLTCHCPPNHWIITCLPCGFL